MARVNNIFEQVDPEHLCSVPNVFFFATSQGDVCDYSSIERAFVGVDVVIHMASFGMSGREMVSFVCVNVLIIVVTSQPDWSGVDMTA